MTVYQKPDWRKTAWNIAPEWFQAYFGSVKRKKQLSFLQDGTDVKGRSRVLAHTENIYRVKNEAGAKMANVSVSSVSTACP